MRTRRIACLILGVWMGAGLWMLWIARDIAASPDRLLLSPSPAALTYFKTLGRASLSPLSHYLAAEQNRALFEAWGVVQIALAGAFFCFLLFGTRLGKFPLAIGLVLLLIAVGERMVVAPGMEMVGRATDFNLDPSHKVRLVQESLDWGYGMAEVFKYLLASIAAAILIMQSNRRSSDSRNEIDLIDKADYRHIDR